MKHSFEVKLAAVNHYLAGHGDVPDELIDFTFEWKGLKKLCVAVSFRSIIAEQKKEPEMTVRYYISSHTDCLINC